MSEHLASDKHRTDSHDKVFFDTFMLVLGGLGMIALLILFLSRAIHANTAAAYLQESEFAQAAVSERIAPVGEVRYAGDAEVTIGGGEVMGMAPVHDSAAPMVDDDAVMAEESAAPTVGGQAPMPEAPAAPRVASGIDGAQVYNTACMACHNAGIAGAPRTGDAAAWAPRIEQGMDVLYARAIAGYQGSSGFMPAKGGNASLGDDEVRAAVDFMVEQSQ